MINNKSKLKELELKLVRYKKIYDEKKKNFKGVKHESSLSELRYTEFMVYKNIVESLMREIKMMKSKSL